MLHSPHKQPQNHKCGANFLQQDSKKSLVFKWLISAGHYQPPRPTESFKAASSIYQRGYKFYLKKKRGTMASNSLFSTVTPCQQNFFWVCKHFTLWTQTSNAKILRCNENHSTREFPSRQ
uniref:RUNX family transcription factor 2 n=1 Tax=Oryctolagus cuniculus TaxID=9986 RepID=A0A5F9CE64_RABIT